MPGRQLTVGVLALQGAFAKHIEMLQSLEVQTREVRYPDDLNNCDGLIIPGGESTVISRQMDYIGFSNALKEFAAHKPIFGTCAGLILMSKIVVASPLKPFGFIDIEVERNAYGRQAESFRAVIDATLVKEKARQISAIFIRAPRIRKWSAEVAVLATYDNEPVLVKQGLHLAATFHPELTGDPSLHRYYLSIVKQVTQS